MDHTEYGYCDRVSRCHRVSGILLDYTRFRGECLKGENMGRLPNPSSAIHMMIDLKQVQDGISCIKDVDTTGI